MEYLLALLVDASVPFCAATSALGRRFTEGDGFDEQAEIRL